TSWARSGGDYDAASRAREMRSAELERRSEKDRSSPRIIAVHRLPRTRSRHAGVELWTRIESRWGTLPYQSCEDSAPRADNVGSSSVRLCRFRYQSVVHSQTFPAISWRP